MRCRLVASLQSSLRNCVPTGAPGFLAATRTIRKRGNTLPSWPRRAPASDSLHWVTEAMDDATCGSRYSKIEEDLGVLGESFGLGEIQACRFLPNGLMNGNWRLETADGAFALKRIMDVPLPLARRNLAVLSELADAGVPVGRPMATSSGETVAEVAGRGYCLIPWLEGGHQPGTGLTLAQAGDLGLLLGQIHRSLNGERTIRLLPPPSEPLAAPVTTPYWARAEADRFLALIAALDSPTAFDAEAAQALGEHKVLLDKYAHFHPGTEVAAGPGAGRTVTCSTATCCGGTERSPE